MGYLWKTLDKMGLDPHILARGLDPPISAKTLDHPILAKGWTAHPSQGLDHRFYPSTVLLRPILARGWTTHFINKKGWTTPLYWLGWGDLTPPPSSPRGSKTHFYFFGQTYGFCWISGGKNHWQTTRRISLCLKIFGKVAGNLSVRPPACLPNWKIFGKIAGQHAGKLDIPTTKSRGNLSETSRKHC